MTDHRGTMSDDAPGVAGGGRPGDAAVGGGPARRAAELDAAQFDTVAAAAEECDAPVATGVMQKGVWR